jgi:hypothetical protein
MKFNRFEFIANEINKNHENQKISMIYDEKNEMADNMKIKFKFNTYSFNLII